MEATRHRPKYSYCRFAGQGQREAVCGKAGKEVGEPNLNGLLPVRPGSPQRPIVTVCGNGIGSAFSPNRQIPRAVM